MKHLLTSVAFASVIVSAAMAEPKEWTLDLGHAYVGWEIDHMLLSPTVGRFDDFDGTFLIDEADPTNSQITFTVSAASVNSNHVGRDNHLRGADYLNVAAFPDVTFTSTDIEMFTPTSGLLHGDVTLLGVTAPLTLEFEMVQDRTYPDFIPNYDEIRVVGFEATGTLERLDHGMDFIAFLGSPSGLAIEFDIHFDLVDCEGMPDTNVPCNWGRVEGFTGPNES